MLRVCGILVFALSALFANHTGKASTEGDGGIYVCKEDDRPNIEVRVDLNTQNGQIKIYNEGWVLTGPYAYYSGPSYEQNHVRRYSIADCALQYTVETDKYFLHCGIMGNCLKVQE